ncbi:histone deacetylase [Persicimonas caeni]|uniref:Histone deacetylase n=1 Tax=Persicimonas caeni TaxID=2292766 RepID=A0A4Y6Q2F6_PERCE|nr:histone deacetylase [Persicimonas caeni]QDG54746.1 histone deacetylase [Persicimonas caeni]QED35967.1 histone deacetylase [Persicimonas caeni]
MPKNVVLLYDKLMLSHDTGQLHPERPDRLYAIQDALRCAEVPGVRWQAPKPATRKQIERIHTCDHVDQIEAFRGRAGRLDADTPLSEDSVAAAYLAAGAAIDAVDVVHKNPSESAFALVRPPGHHAERDQAMGFCLFNNIAVAAAHAVDTLGYKRVLVIDWDVHHGNGTHYSFYDRREVMVFNTHRYPFYPGTGQAKETGISNGAGYTVNVPLPPGMGDGDYKHAFETVLEPIADAYEPDLVLVSAGFDSHRLDPLGGMEVTSEGFGGLCTMVQRIADKHADGRLALILEGGYSLEGLSQSVLKCVEVLAGTPYEIDDEPSENGYAAIVRARRQLRMYWNV